MAFFVPSPGDVTIDNSDPEEFFPDEFNGSSDSSVDTKDSGMARFGNGYAMLNKVTSNPSTYDSKTANGCIISPGTPCNGLELSMRFSLEYSEISNLSSCIPSSDHQVISLSAWTALNGYAENNPDKRYQAMYAFGLSGFYNAGSPDNDKYHFRWVFINHSCAKNGEDDPSELPGVPVMQVFYINADNDVDLLSVDGQGNMEEIGTIREREAEEESIVTSPNFLFRPKNDVHTVEMFLDRIRFDDGNPTNVVIDERDSGDIVQRKSYAIDDSSWGTNGDNILSCTASNSSESRTIILNPFNLFSTYGTSEVSSVRNFCLFGLRRKVNPTGNTVLFPIHMSLYDLAIYYSADKRPIERWLPFCSINDSTTVARGLVNVIGTTLLPFNLESKSAGIYNASYGTLTTREFNVEHGISQNMEDMADNDFRKGYVFSHWETSDNKRAFPNSFFHSGFDGSGITAVYDDVNLVMDMETRGDEIVEIGSGKTAKDLTDSPYDPADDDCQMIRGGYRFSDESEAHVISIVDDDIAGKCMSFGMFQNLMIKQDLVDFPEPLSGDSMTLLGWFKFEHCGMERLNRDGTISKFSPTNADFDALMAISNKKEGETFVNGIPYVNPNSLGGWGRLGLLCSGKTLVWRDNNFVSYPRSMSYYLDINSNGNFNKFDLRLDTRQETDPRKSINMATANFISIPEIGNLPEYRYIDSTGQLVKSGMDGYTPKNSLPAIYENFNAISGNWTFIAHSIDPGGAAGRYTPGRGFSMGCIRNQTTNLVTNPSLSSLSSTNSLLFKEGPFSTIFRDYKVDDSNKPWLVFGYSNVVESNNGVAVINKNTIPDSGLWFTCPFLCKYIKVYNRAFTMEELEAIYQSEKGAFGIN